MVRSSSARTEPQQPSTSYPGLLCKVRVHLLLAERRHVMDLLVVSLHNLPVLWDLLGVK